MVPAIRNSILCFFFLWSRSAGALAPVLYEGGTIVAFDESTESLDVIAHGSVLIEGNTISQIYRANETFSTPLNITRIDATGKIITPGFIDGHHHLWQTAFRSIASNTTLIEYFQRYSEFSQALQYFSVDDVALGYLMSIFEMMYGGTTTVLDHAHATWGDNYVDAAVDATFDSGIRSYFAYAVHDLPNGYTWDDQLSKVASLAAEDRFRAQAGTVKLGLAYDNFFIAPEANITALWNLIQSYNLSIYTTHYVGGPWGEFNSPTALQSHGWLNTSLPVVLSHASFLSYEDAGLLRETNQYICSTPESEFHYGHVNPNAHNIQDQAALGVDTHFTYSASVIQQARLWLQSLRSQAYLEPAERFETPLNNPMSVEQAFHLITRAGALALRRPDLGAIKVGARADLVVWKTDSPSMIGASDPIAAVILHSEPADVEDVLVDGKFVKRNGKLVYKGYEGVKKAFEKSAKRIQGIWANTTWPPLEKFPDPQGGPYAMAPVIDTLGGTGTGY